jgi:hypothetical protein
MSNKTYAIKIQNQLGAAPRFFSGFGKNKLAKTAWSLAGAELFLNHARLGQVLRQLESSGRHIVVVGVAVTHEAVDLEVCPF